MLGSVLLWPTFPWAPFGPMGRRRLLELAAAQTGSLAEGGPRVSPHAQPLHTRRGQCVYQDREDTGCEQTQKRTATVLQMRQLHTVFQGFSRFPVGAQLE